MEDAKKIKITVDKSHLFTLGEKMYRESIEFVRELVNNAYDADATEVRIMICDDKITIGDNGAGMNERGLAQFFTVGSKEKTIESVSPRFGRKRIGQFGIGKFSALSLADQFMVESVKGGMKYSVTFDRALWQATSDWDLPIKREPATPFDREGTTIILNNLTKKVGLAEVEKYLMQSVPLRAKKFSIFLNNKRIAARTIPGKIFPINIKTLYGQIEGNIVLALDARDVALPGVECRVKQVFIKRDLFGIEKKHAQGMGRITGSVNADFLPLISSRSDFIIDSQEYKLFSQLLCNELDIILREIKKQSDIKNIKKITEELQEIMKQVRGALILNPDFVPRGRAITRLKQESKKGIVAAGANFAKEKVEQKESAGKDGGAAAVKKETEKAKPTEQKMEAEPLAIKKIRVNQLGISCGIVSLGADGPEVMSQGNLVYINQDYPLYQRVYGRREALTLHLLRLITQEIILMKKTNISAREAFLWQSKLLKDAIC